MDDNLDYKYLYTLQSEDLIKLFLTNDSEFEELKAEMIIAGKEGVKAIQRNNLYTIVIDAEIRGKFEINEIINENCSKLLLVNVKVFSFYIINSQLLAINKDRFSITIDKCIIDRIHIENSITGHINIKNCSISEFTTHNSRPLSIQIDGSSFAKFRIENCTILNVFIEDSTFGDFHFYFTISRNFRIYKQSTIGFLCIHGETINELQILDSNIKQFDARELYCSLLIKNSIVPFLNLMNCSVIDFSIESFCKMAAHITNGQVNKLYFKRTGFNPEMSISFSKTRIYSVLMEEFSMLGNLYFRQIIRAETPFEWYNYENNIITLPNLDQELRSRIFEQRENQYDQLRRSYYKHCENLKGIIDKATIRISHSSLGKTEFTGCPLADFQIEFNNSKITDCFVSGDSIPTQNVHILGAEPNSIEEYQQKASFFNQFKKIFEAQGDIYHATQFQAKWSEEQRNELKLRKKEEYKNVEKPIWWSKIKVFFNTTSNDRLTLWLNKISNLHGESWVRAFFWILALGLIFYLPYLFSIGRLFTPGKFDFNLIGYYFEFLNPTHKFNFINEGNIANGLTVFIDVVWRIIVAYLIYQFISAFRKHTKKQ